MSTHKDIVDRQQDYDAIHKETSRAELGLRAVSFMYHDYSEDKNSYENILKLKDNIHYRLFSAAHQYLVFLRELKFAENHLQNVYQKNPHFLNAFPMGNPYFDTAEQSISSIFDNIIFQLSSVFDYLSHVVCYITFESKSNTLYWTKLAKLLRDKNNSLNVLEIKKSIDEADRRFVGRLYDYRSRLLHNKRDQHFFSFETRVNDFDFKIKIIPSSVALKHFKLIADEVGEQEITLTYLASWLIKRTFIEIELILDSIVAELKKNSSFQKNLAAPKQPNLFMIVSINPQTKLPESTSEYMWKEYKGNNKN